MNRSVGRGCRIVWMLMLWPLAVWAGNPVAGALTGQDEKGVRIQIRAVDGKAVKGEPVRLTPGTHRLAVSCIKTESYGAQSIDTVLVLTVKPDCDYELLGFFEGKNAKVAVKEKGVR